MLHTVAYSMTVIFLPSYVHFYESTHMFAM